MIAYRTDVDIQCTANVIVDSCEDRDIQRYHVFTISDISDILQILCTN